MAQLRQRESELVARNISVKIVTFDGDVLATAYAQSTNLAWPLLFDRDLTLYSAFGMAKGSWWSIYGPSSIWKYLTLIFSGRKPGKPGSDWRQMGGDVLIDPEGIVRLHHISSSPHDRPEVDHILSLVDQAS